MASILRDAAHQGSSQSQTNLSKPLAARPRGRGVRGICRVVDLVGPQQQRAASDRQAVLRFKQEDCSEASQSESSAAAEAVSPTLQPEEKPQYNWREQWYPVHYARDVPEGEPQRVWLFDEPIVIARRPGKGPIALLDRCPHRAAALSEGRMTSSGDLQCAYHGWSFNGETGDCTNIPQVSHGGTISGRTCATALPCVERQGLLWVYPSPGAQDPPTDSIVGLPELDEPGWTSDDFIRDFPVDFTLVLENVADPDHGIFAHQTPIFDSFAASAEYPMQVTTEPGRAGPKVIGRVPGVLKMTRKEKDKEKDKAMFGEQGKATDVVATLEFEAPTHVRWSRYDASGKTSFITAFYCSPAGFGKTRFFTRYVRNIAPQFHPPRWLFNIFLNQFLDQDTYLLATQQEVTLAAELAAHMASSASPENGHDSHSSSAAEGSGIPTGATGLTRRRIFCHRSPTDNLLVAMGRWMDETIPLVPNRYRTALQTSAAGVESPPAVWSAPRAEVLDRYSGHTVLCPDSMAAYKTSQRAQSVLSVAAGLGSAAAVSYAAAATTTGSLQAGLLAKCVIACALLAGAAAGAKAVASQFVYVYTRDKQTKDLKRITNFVADK
ncbi:g10200 [Coccomyxa viridis]|uniref:G10200 protein n=1 Tax=Coccomyxa viridis TaxID=1274662 RepID=A0ABP1G554_9CHLO